MSKMHKGRIEAALFRQALLWLLVIACCSFGLHHCPALAVGEKVYRQACFRIVGLGCLTCIRDMERTIRLTPGVLAVAVSAINKGNTTIIYDGGQVSLAKLTDGIKKQGYEIRAMKDTAIKAIPEELPSADKNTQPQTASQQMEKPQVPPLKLD